MTSIPEKIPAGLKPYRRTPIFTPDTLPAALRQSHATKAGTWGLIHVLEGKLLYELESPRTGRQIAAAGETVVIEAEAPHHVAFIAPGRFFIELYRAPGT